MPRILAPLAIVIALSSVVNAGIEFTKPEAGSKSKGGASLSVEWKEGGTGPSISDLSTYTLDVCTGGNDAAVRFTMKCGIASITPSAKFSSGNSIEGPIAADIGASTPENAYFLRMVATATKGDTYTVYSKRFTMTDMTGTFNDTVLASLEEVTDSSGPDTLDSIGKRADTVVPTSMYDVEYTMQTGATRYAPMQPIPGTKITKSTASPLFPTSSVSVAKSHLPIPSILTTVTQSQTHSVSSMENTIAAASHSEPADDMARFLARWKD
ncbi:hypothetical protein P280DRAFT_408362 [Massarina eburnea CBS 473.64]|uniref:Uncharacterized protein n=1 Tax=Massarina eburnea CBS 473.64 TaxID=1395130 RepID=A0A6A6RR91_9PLEO|nr:hypothetical protein P280DRAFT_408362 [Massarina eburnea CBS 473.64]